MKRNLAGMIVVLLVAHSASGQEHRTVLADEGQAKYPVVVSANASESEKKSAATLADYLHRISGAKFQVEVGNGKSGIAVGRLASFPDLGLPALGDKKDPTRVEDYVLRSHAQGIYLLGATDLAVQHAVWDLLRRLGHRQFFPGPTWEVVPTLRTVAIAVDVKEHPDYLSRSIWYGYGAWDYNGQHYQDWCARNRMARGIDLHSGHAYDAIIRRNAAEFKQHPEYLGLLNGERRSTKFCVGNPDLRKLIVADALRQLEAKPDLQSISLEPSDGTGWCQCDRCKALGSPSNRALTLANDAAEALTAKYGDRFVGMYAYSEHSPPPTIKVHPRVIISVATAFVRGGFTIDQLLEGWQKQGATLGIREYYSVNTWDRDLPGAARGGRLDYIKITIPAFHARGVRFFNSESSDNWGPNGLGYYLAAQVLWNVKDVARWDALVDDFLDKSFGPAREPMAKFYRLIDGGNRPLLSDDLVGRMYRLLEEARGKTQDPRIHARLDDLLLYTRYVELYSDYTSATGAMRQQHFESLIKHAYRMRKTMMVHTKALYRDLDNRDKSVTVPTEAAWNVPEAKNPWKSSVPFARDELAAILASGIATRKLLDFTRVSFSDTLVPAKKLNLPKVKDGTFGIYHRGVNNFLLWTDQPASIKLSARGGIIYRDKGDAKFFLFPAAEPEGKDVSRGQVAPDKEAHPVELKTTYSGLHRLQITDGSAGTHLDFPMDIGAVTVQSSPEAPFRFHGRWTMYFYVPKGTKTVGGFAGGEGLLRDGQGKEVHKFPTKPGYFSIPVAAGQDGSLWKFEKSIGVRQLMTVPPYLARNGQELLLPREVVERDSGKE